MDNKEHQNTRFDHLPANRTRARKEWITIISIVLVVCLLTFAETRMDILGQETSVSNTVLMYFLINTNLLLLLTLILLVFRNLTKLYYERKNRVVGAKLKTRLVAAFVTLALVPTTVLFFFSIHFISRSIAFWYNAPVEQALDQSLLVGRQLYSYVEDQNRFWAQRAAYQITSTKLLAQGKAKELSRYVQVVQRAFNLHAVEIYTPDAKRSTLSLASELKESYFGLLTSDDLMTIPVDAKVKTVSQTLQEGEVIKTIAAIPFGAAPEKTQAFIVITALLSPELSKNLESISKGVEEYQQLKMIKKPVQVSNYIALSIVALLVIFCAIWFGFYLARMLTIPIVKLAEGTQRLTHGDLNHRIDFQADDEIGTLIQSFNFMTERLETGRKKLAHSEQMLRDRNEEIEKSRKYMEVVLKNISAGVISLTNSGIITTMNKAAETMLNLNSEQILGKNYRDILSPDYLEIAHKIEQTVSFTPETLEFPLSVTIDGRPKHFAVYFNSLKTDAGDTMGAVMVFDDVTQLEKAQRLAAWREVARRIAHEVKNPLTPIKLSAQRLKRKYSKTINEDVFDKCTQTIVEHVDLIRNLVNEFSTFAKFPDTNILPCRLETIMDETVALYKEGLEHVEINTLFSDNLPEMKLDRQQMKQALINLMDNAVSAVNKNGKIDLEAFYDPIINIVRIEIADNGKGISDEEKTRLFEPYFSTKKSGMGLGLAIVNSIITDHKGMIRVLDNKPKGARFIIELPV